MYIGRRDDGLYFEGKIDDVMVYDAALNSWEISQLYDEGNKAYVYSDNVIGDVFRGSNCTATGTKAVAFGDGTTASGEYSTAFGKDTIADGNYATAMGLETVAGGNYATAMGYLSRATGDYSTAFGYLSKATGDYSFAVGREANSVRERSIALGYKAQASDSYAIAIGCVPIASGYLSTAIGTGAKAIGNYSIVMGYASEASESDSIVIGYRNKATADRSMASGKLSINDVADSFTVGYGSSIGNEQVDFRVRSGLVNVYGDLDVSQKVTMGTLILPVKTTTGDPASPVEGQIYVNTYDNKVRVYADGAWRDLSTW
jgi:hypothetical protein